MLTPAPHMFHVTMHPFSHACWKNVQGCEIWCQLMDAEELAGVADHTAG